MAAQARRIVLIDPPGFTLGLNTGLGYLCGALQGAGRSVRVLDFNNKPGRVRARLEAVRDADLVGFSLKSSGVAVASELAVQVRRLNPQALLVAGGAHISVVGGDFLAESSVFDACLAGEGESAMAALAAGAPFQDIPGFFWREAGRIRGASGASRRVSRLDELPLPDYSAFDSVAEGGMDEYPLVTSRGCPHACSYCSVRLVMGAAWRARSPERILDELALARRRYSGLRAFRVLDDNFTLDLARAKEFCRGLMGKDWSWSCPNGVRADRLDVELLDLMKASGCRSIAIGIESLDEGVFGEVHKGESLEAIIQAVRLAQAAGLEVDGFFIIGLPRATYAKDMQTLKKAQGLGLRRMMWGMAVPYPGTPMAGWARQNAHILRDWRGGCHTSFNPPPLFETQDYSASERIRAYRRAYLRSVRISDWPVIFRYAWKSLQNLF